MMTEEDAKHLTKAYEDLKEHLAQKDQCFEELEGLPMRALPRREVLERQLAQDSHNSSKPPSSDGLGRKLGMARKKTEKPTGRHQGLRGYTLMQAQMPDSVASHRHRQCKACQLDLQQEPGSIKEHRQVYNVPEVRLLVQEHQIEVICCPACQHLTRRTFPTHVQAPAQYDPQVQTMAVPLPPFQLLPLERTCETSKISITVRFLKQLWCAGLRKRPTHLSLSQGNLSSHCETLLKSLVE
jgi:transposase